ncbi:MAG: hypothetical protein K2N07_10515 [Desulfovibrio sp.]|nr:hypothetical protein [Desulfovibrio sp.]
MSETTITEHQLQPYFDIEEFMGLCQEKRLGGAVLERLLGKWEAWQPLLKAAQVKSGSSSWLAVWLPEEVETAVDKTWAQSASEGFQLNALAQYLCMSAIQEVLPQVAAGGCAPSPKPSQELRSALAGLGLPYKDEDSSALGRRYAVLTYYPFKGGCEVCYMRPQCPKGQGRGENATVVLPGYERDGDSA